jgi:PST family polysaccharide transporter
MPAMAFLMVNSDWVIDLVLGPGWEESVLILSWLALTGMFQPIGNSTGWLFVSQNRTKEMFHWGSISATITVLSFVIGLPWGAWGVAASYALASVLVRMHLLYWFVGRRGSVTTRDLYSLLGLPLLLSVAVIALTLLLRPWLQPFPRIGAIAIAGFLAIVVSLSILRLVPSGRNTLKELRDFLSMLR